MSFSTIPVIYKLTEAPTSNTWQLWKSSLDVICSRVMFISLSLNVTVIVIVSLGSRRLLQNWVFSPDSRTAGMATMYSLWTQKHTQTWDTSLDRTWTNPRWRFPFHPSYYLYYNYHHSVWRLTYGPAIACWKHKRLMKTHSVHAHIWVLGRPMVDWYKPNSQHLLASKREFHPHITCRMEQPPLFIWLPLW